MDELASWVRGMVRVATVTRLEVGCSARSGLDLRAATQRPQFASMPVELQTPAIEERAVEVQHLLADHGRHGAPSVPDLIVAATAELAGLTVLHLDKDFDLIAEITGHPTERLAATPAEPHRGQLTTSPTEGSRRNSRGCRRRGPLAHKAL